MSGGDKLTDRKRAMILKAAADAFREDGFHATSMDRVAERAGVSKRTVYNHFESKDALFDVVIDACWQRLVPSPAAAQDAAVPMAERLGALAHARLDALLDPELIGLFRVVLAEMGRSPGLERAYRSESGHLEVLGVTEVLRQEIAGGRLQIARPEIAALHFWGLTIGGLFWPTVLGLREPVRAEERRLLVEEGVATFLARYGAPAQPSANAPAPRDAKREPAQATAPGDAKRKRKSRGTR